MMAENSTAVAPNADLPMCENASGRKTADLGPHPLSSAFLLFGVRNCSRCLLHT
jgi:hypothetical protein